MRPSLKPQSLFERLSEGFQSGVYHLMEPAFTVAQVLVFIVSLVTTYWGFSLILAHNGLALAAAVGLQSMIFWLPRKLLLSRPWRRRAGEFFVLSLTLCVSILFSYQAFVDKLVPKELRELRTLESAFLMSQPVVNRAMSGVGAAVAIVDAAVKRFDALADRELKQGGTGPTGRSPAGSGRISGGWLNRRDTERARLATLLGVQAQARTHFAEISQLQADEKKTPGLKRAELRERINNILALAQNPFVLEVLAEEPNTSKSVDDLRRLTTPAIDEPPTDTSAIAVRDRFIRGLTVGSRAMGDLLAGRDIDRFGVGALVALFIACVIDLLVVILGYLAAARFIPPSVRRLVDLIAGAGLLVRHGLHLGLRVQRDTASAPAQLRRTQELALEALRRQGWLRLVAVSDNPGDFFVLDKDLLIALIEAEEALEDVVP